MKTTQFTENGWQLTQLGFVNCYLVRESKGFSLIDTGVLANGAKHIVETAKGLGGTIRRILLTHAHTDHVGSVDGLIAALGWSDVELVSNARSLPLLRKAKPTKLVSDDELFGVFRCIETPGHIPGHVSFVDERDGTLYAGDALTAIHGLRVSSDSPWYFPFPKLVTWNKEVTMSSAEKLLGYSIERFACGHGAVRDGGMPALRGAIQLAKR